MDELTAGDESPLFEPDGSLGTTGIGGACYDQLMPDSQPPLAGDSVSLKIEVENAKLLGAPNADDMDGLRKRKIIDTTIGLEDDDKDFDGDEMVPPHVPENEPLPHLPIYHPLIPEVRANCLELVNRFRTKISELGYQDKETEYLDKMFSDLENPRHETNTVQIALVGDAGHGKSSTINSLLGVDIAEYGDDGDSCTYVVQEYAQASPRQTHPFMAEVYFFCRQMCVETVRSAVKSIFSYVQKDEDVDEEELEELRANSNTALSTLMALFQDRPAFQDKSSAEKFLQGASSADDPKVLGRLLGWMQDILQELVPDNETDSKTFLYSTTVADIKKAIEPFTKTMEFPNIEGTGLRCCLWPLVKRVRINFETTILGQHIVLADCPGVNDKNKLRVESTRRYLEECRITIVVNRIDRAIDHASFNNNINNAWRRGRSPGTIVVCTRSDDINMKGKQNFPYTVAEERMIAEINKDEILNNQGLEHVRTSLKKHGLGGDLNVRLRLQSRKARYEFKEQEIQHRRLEVRVLARNRHVCDGVSAQYKQDTKEPTPLTMFCIANTVYASHVAGYRKRNTPCLTLHGTGIPELRNHIYAIPSEGKLRSLAHYCHVQFETALNTVVISCSTTKLKRKEDLNNTFIKARKSLKGNVEGIAYTFVESFHELLKRIGEWESKWINRAGRKCEIWAKLPPPGHKAVVKKKGTHSTKKVPPQNWNGELLKIVCADLDDEFEELHNTRCGDLSRQVADRVSDVIQKITTTLDHDPAASLTGAIGAFRKNLHGRQKRVENICEQFEDLLKKSVRKIHARACTEGENHYLPTAMEEVYDQALKAKSYPGSTLHFVRCDTFKKLLCAHNGVFMEIHGSINEDFREMFLPMIAKLVKDLDNVFALIQHDVDKVCSTNEDDSPEAKAMREELLAMLPSAREFLKEKVQTQLRRCKEPRD